jgi:Centromere DNA-binding protein complex CBF3 subunit, domain 2
LDLRIQQFGRRANDYALRNFLRLLIWFRRVLLQDAVVIYQSHPSCAIFGFAPFNTPTFKLFADQAPSVITDAEKKASEALRNLPEHVVQSVRGVVMDVGMAQRQQNDEIQNLKNAFESKMASLESVLALALGSKKNRKPGQSGKLFIMSRYRLYESYMHIFH